MLKGLIAGMIGVQVTASGHSIASSATMESRVTTMESKLDDMEKSIVASIQSTLQQLLKPNEPPGGERAGEPNG